MGYKLLTLAALAGFLCWRSVKNGEGRIAFLSAMGTIAALAGAL